MSSDKQNATVFAGDDAILNVAITDENGVALDLTGCTLEWAMAPFGGATALTTKTVANGGITVDAPGTGVASIFLTHTDTAGLSGKMWHQLVVTDGDGMISTVMSGTLTFIPRT